jgi:hypothetical protein
MATRSLSPKRTLERMRQHRQCVIVLAQQSAIKVIKAQIRAQGDKLSQVPMRTTVYLLTLTLTFIVNG